jgi:glutaredoxin
LIEDKDKFLLFIKERSKIDYRTFPMVFKDGKFIGGFDDTQKYLNQQLLIKVLSN